MATSASSTKISARRRLQRDILELERNRIPSIAAVPMENNLFEWHVNISPLDGVYSEIYFHLIMRFPNDYPFKPPKISICTPISHPNIFGSFLCLSMLRENTSNHPYEGWSSSYSITSILMQLQSFLFAKKIEQDGGYTVDARLSRSSVESSIRTCTRFTCYTCGHSHSSPFPEVIKALPSISRPRISYSVPIQMIDTNDSEWTSAYAAIIVNDHSWCRTIYYEATVTSINIGHDKKHNNNNNKKRSTKSGPVMAYFGFGNKYATTIGGDRDSFGYGGTGKFCANNHYISFGQAVSNHDTITCALDLDNKRVYFAKNGRIQESRRVLPIDDELCQYRLCPMVTFKNSRIDFNFGEMANECPFLTKRGFECLGNVYGLQEGPATSVSDTNSKYEQKNEEEEEEENKAVDWYHEGIINEIWMSIFECLEYNEIFSCQFVCKLFYHVIDQFNIMERPEVVCFFTKEHYRSRGTILGIGLNIKEGEHKAAPPVIKSQMDYMSLKAWRSGLRDGVWGEQMTHFLPLVINKQHSEKAHDEILAHLKEIASLWPVTRTHPGLNKAASNPQQLEALKLLDVVITMMNQLVVQFVMDNKEKNNNENVEMIFCDKVVLGYCLFHHLLLYLAHHFEQQHGDKFVTKCANHMVQQFRNGTRNGSHKRTVPDLGKFLIYSMLSDRYEWNDFAVAFMKESMSRRVLWLIREHPQLNTTSKKNGRERMFLTSDASVISRRLVMFQCWFMRSNKHCTLKQYNDRLGRPSQMIRGAIQSKTKSILSSKAWRDYMKQLQLKVENDNFPLLLRYAVARSYQSGYHHCQHAEKLIDTELAPPKCFCLGDDGKAIKPTKKNQHNHKKKQNRVKTTEERKSENGEQWKTGGRRRRRRGRNQKTETKQI